MNARSRWPNFIINIFLLQILKRLFNPYFIVKEKHSFLFHYKIWRRLANSSIIVTAFHVSWWGRKNFAAFRRTRFYWNTQWINRFVPIVRKGEFFVTYENKDTLIKTLLPFHNNGDPLWSWEVLVFIFPCCFCPAFQRICYSLTIASWSSFRLRRKTNIADITQESRPIPFWRGSCVFPPFVFFLSCSFRMSVVRLGQQDLRRYIGKSFPTLSRHEMCHRFVSDFYFRHCFASWTMEFLFLPIDKWSNNWMHTTIISMHSYIDKGINYRQPSLIEGYITNGYHRFSFSKKIWWKNKSPQSNRFLLSPY